jgi:hypothetical protein
MTVLLLNVGHGHHLSDGTALPRHVPLLLARAGNCAGQCPTGDASIARYIYADKASDAALDSLQDALGAGGGAWRLNGSDLSLQKGSSDDPDFPALVVRKDVRGTVDGALSVIPTTASEREDFSWVADLHQICPDCSIDPTVLGTQPPVSIAARFVLRTGNVFTYSVARIGSKVTPVQFKRLDGQGTPSSYSQAVATWVGADVAISGNSVEIIESKFNGGPGRSMTLSPDSSGKVEIAILNLPSFVPPASPHNDAPQVGKHFESLYDVTANPPAVETRLVPFAGAAPGTAAYPEVDWTLIHPQDALWSELLNRLRLNIGRSAYDRLLCPPTQGG